MLLETVTKLEAASSIARDGLGQALRDVLDQTNGEEGPGVEAAAMKKAQGRLTEAKKRFAKLHLPGKGFEVVGPGLEASYRKARRAFQSAYVERTDESFHEWRKGTQQHWRHMALLLRAWPDCFAARISEARRLSQLLGDDHDLMLLVAFVQSDAGERIGPERAATLEKLARQRQNELRAVAQPTGLRVFAEGARALHRSMATYWEAAVALKEHEPDEAEAAKCRRLRARSPRGAGAPPLPGRRRCSVAPAAHIG